MIIVIMIIIIIIIIMVNRVGPRRWLAGRIGSDDSAPPAGFPENFELSEPIHETVCFSASSEFCKPIPFWKYRSFLKRCHFGYSWKNERTPFVLSTSRKTDSWQRPMLSFSRSTQMILVYIKDFGWEECSRFSLADLHQLRPNQLSPLSSLLSTNNPQTESFEKKYRSIALHGLGLCVLVQICAIPWPCWGWWSPMTGN